MENNLVIIENENPVTTSLMVSEVFEKKHKHVLDSIRRILAEAPGQNSAKGAYFIESEYFNDLTKKMHPMYYITKRGFTLLAMGFTGKKALGFKVAYMDAFEEMETALKKKNPAVAKPMSQLEVLQASINALVEQEHRITAVESSVEQINKKINELEEERRENGKLLLQERINDALPVPEISIRDKTRKLVNMYSSYMNILQVDVWKKIYDTLYYNYRIHVNGIKRRTNESKLEALERLGHTEKIYSIICSMCNNAGIINKQI